MSDCAWLIAGQPDTYPAARNEGNVPDSVLENACQQAPGTLVVFPRNGEHGRFDLNAWKASKTPNPWYPWRTMVQRAMFLGGLEARACLARASYCLPHLEHVDFETLKGNAACNLSGLFAGCAALETVDLAAVFKGACAENVSEMFYGRAFLSSVEFPDGFFDEAADASMMLYGCTSIRAFSFDWSAERLESAQEMFANCKGVRTVSLPFAAFEKCKNGPPFSSDRVSESRIGLATLGFFNPKAYPNAAPNLRFSASRACGGHASHGAAVGSMQCERTLKVLHVGASAPPKGFALDPFS